MTNQKPPRPAGNRHRFVFFVTLREILHLGGNNPGLHVDLSRFQSLNQPGRGRIARTYTHRDWIVGSAGIAAVGDAPSTGTAFGEPAGVAVVRTDESPAYVGGVRFFSDFRLFDDSPTRGPHLSDGESQ